MYLKVPALFAPTYHFCLPPLLTTLYRLFVLLGPQNTSVPSTSGAPAIPNVLCVLQVAFEGFISQKSIQSEMSRSSKASGVYYHLVTARVDTWH